MNFTQSTLFNLIASVGLLFISVIINVIESRLLGPQEMGRFSIFLTTQTFFVTIFALGIGQACIYFINSLKRNIVDVVTSSVKFILPFSFLANLALFATLSFFSGYFQEDNKFYLLLFCVGTNALLVNTILIPVLLANMQVVKHQIVKYVSQITVLFALVCMLLFNIQIETGILLVLTGLSNVVSLVLLYRYLRKYIQWRHSMNLHLVKELFLWGMKLSGNNMASIILNSIPVYFLSWFSIAGEGMENVGYYTRSSTLLVAGTVVISSIGPLIYAKWSALEGDVMKEQVQRLSFLLCLFNLVVALLLVIFSKFLITLLYGSDFLPAIPVLKILAFTLVFNGVKEICYGILSSRGVPLKIMKNLFIGSVALGVIAFFLIPLFGVIGCAYATLAITALTSFLLMLDVRKVSSVLLKDFVRMPSKVEILSIINNIIFRK